MTFDGLQLRMLRSRSTCKSELALHEMAWNDSYGPTKQMMQPDEALYQGDVLSLDTENQWDTEISVVWASENVS